MPAAGVWFSDAARLVAKLVMVSQQPFLMSTLLLEWLGTTAHAVAPKIRLCTALDLKMDIIL